MAKAKTPFTDCSQPVPGLTPENPGVLLFGRTGCPLSNSARVPLLLRCNFCGEILKAWSVDHGFHATRASTCADTHRFAQMPGGAAAVKAAGRAYKTPRTDWELPAPTGKLSVQADAMLSLLRSKYVFAPFAQILDNTGDAVLVADLPTDPFWGAGADGDGINVLGRLLMLVRAERRGETVIKMPEATAVTL